MRRPLAIAALCLAACSAAGDVRDASVDAAPGDGGARDAATDAGPPDLGPVLYPEGQRHSPITAELASGLRAIAARGPTLHDDVFAKVGDSITATPGFLGCFATVYDLGAETELMATRDAFLAGDAGGSDPFSRTSLAAGVGWSASRAVTGAPTPLDAEVTATQPRFAVLMYGTNDVGFVDVDTFGRNMTEIVDTLIAGGTVPLLSSIPPRDDDAMADARVPTFDGILRALAQARGLPLVDFHADLEPLPDHGLGPDGVHPYQSSLGACVLTPAGLMAGANVRNLITLEQLDRARRVVVLGEAAPEPDTAAPHLRGNGTRADPFVVDALPFAAHGDTRTMGESAVASYACGPEDESGPELRYRFHLDAATHVTATVSSGAGADLDVHFVPAGDDGTGCVARADRTVSAMLAAGDWDLVVDTFAGASGPSSGEALVVLLAS